MISVAAVVPHLSASERSKRASAARPVVGGSRAPGVHPATTEKDYTGELGEFIVAVEAYKKKLGRHFIAPSECFDLFKAMGYSRADAAVY